MVFKRNIILAGERRFDRDPVTRLHLPDQLGEFIFIAVLPDAFVQETVSLIVTSP